RSFNRSLTDSLAQLKAPESATLVEDGYCQTLIDNCKFCCCCQLILNTDSSCNILQAIESFPTYDLVSPELKGYISVPFRPPKSA
ncbi:hypothetical protein CWB77_18185, partial [Pseudoalteromonas sp. S1610]|uniref:hypothetical protein n=1 Tax=Pseudoalteromonas sp. S1610 TaxID=579506 RepID=UPI00110A5A8F